MKNILQPFIFMFKYIYLGFLYLSYLVFGIFKFIFIYLIKPIKYIIYWPRYIFNGFLAICYSVFKFFKYVLYGIEFPIVLLSDMMDKTNSKYKEKTKLEKVKNEEIKLARIKEKEKNVYKNENAKIEKKKFADYIDDFLKLIVNFPKKLVQLLKNKIYNSSFAKNRRNRLDIQRQALLIDFEGEDAEKSDKKIVWQYLAKNNEGRVIKGYFEAYSKVEVHSFLLSEGYEVYEIITSKWIQLLHQNSGKSEVKIKVKDLIFLLTQLSTYIKAGIPLVEALRILSKQFKNKRYQRCFRAIIYDLSMGENFSDALSKQGESFPRLLINMVKASELTGQLPEALDDMSEYYTEVDKTKKQMISAITYPALVFVIAIIVVVFIMVYVVPKFVEIYKSMDGSQVPAFTLFVIAASAFLKTNLVWLIIGTIIFIIIFRYLYKNVKMFKTLIQWLLMHTPIIKNVIIYNEVTMFTKTFASLLSHNVYITDSMDILNKITNNEIYKMLILDTITNLARGEKISLAFKDHWAFPMPAYEMIVTGEKTGELPEMMAKVSSYYQEMHRNAVTRIKAFVEPLLIIFLTFVVGAIVLAIVIPMFGMYEQVQQM